jgi:hypothetical protein
MQPLAAGILHHADTTHIAPSAFAALTNTAAAAAAAASCHICVHIASLPQVMARLSSWHHVYRVSLLIHNPRKAKTVAGLRIWYCDAPLTELQQLKSANTTSSSSAASATSAANAATADPAGVSSSSSSQIERPVWKLAASHVELAPGQSDVSVEFELPLLCSALMLELAGWHVSVNEAAGEVLHCPRCSHIVTDRHGMCGYCRWVRQLLWRGVGRPWSSKVD